jgi:hypothetical protein
LHRRFEEAWEAASSRDIAVSVVERNGVYIEFAGEPGFDLIFESLEYLSSGIRLLNVRKEDDGDKPVTLATVYIPHDKRSHFLRKIEKYAEEETKTGTPKNKPLIESISHIQEATLSSFWQRDEFSMVPESGPLWIEVWLLGESEELYTRFVSTVQEIGIELAEGFLKFPERTVLLIRADRSQLIKLVSNSDDLSEFRIAKKLASYFVELENAEQAEIVQELLSRCTFESNGNVAICLLDSGVNNGHPLLQPILGDEYCMAAISDWPTADEPERPHGTRMAGTAGYGNLLVHLNSSELIQIQHKLESIRILPPHPAANPKELWGYRVAQAVSIAEVQGPNRKRLFCLAVSSDETKERGQPTSWSGAIDKLSSGQDDGIRRLFIVAAGNTSPDIWSAYPDGNFVEEIHDPGQSWNAVTVGAFTELIDIRDSTLAGYHPLAPFQGLSPHSTTSRTWPTAKWPIKPDIVLEGGNVAAGPNDSRFDTEDLQLISTSHDPQVAHFAPFGQTSAASALAAQMAAKIQIEYPDAWPETVRGLMIHSAEWTDEMKRQFLRTDSPTKHQFGDLLRTCGFGVPSLERALYCASNSLTLISEAEIQPFDKKAGNYVTRDMHLYNLPWPAEILLDLAETEVKMHITLSYFVEPAPDQIGWGNRYRYPSHGLRFELNAPSESEEEFVHRINWQARDEDESIETTGPGQYWTIGPNNRKTGSVHSDTWTGTAADLSQSNLIAIYPTTGWWRTRQHLGRWNKKTRYSLLVTINTPEIEHDIYLAVATKIGVTVPVTIPII